MTSSRTHTAKLITRNVSLSILLLYRSKTVKIFHAKPFPHRMNVLSTVPPEHNQEFSFVC